MADWQHDPDLAPEKVRQLAMWAGASVRALLHELGTLRDLSEPESVRAGGVERTPVDQIDCPLCGLVVRQVSSATLSLALWQHFNWMHADEAKTARTVVDVNISEGLCTACSTEPCAEHARGGPIPLNAQQEQAVRDWAADDRLWAEETVDHNLRLFARVILARAESQPARIEFDNHHNALLCPYCNPEKLVLVARGAVEPPAGKLKK